MDAAVRRAVGLALEPRLPYRAVVRDEGRDRVTRPERRRHRDLRIHRRARSPDLRLAVTPHAAVEIEARPEAFAETVDLLEFVFADVEKGALRRRETGEGRSGARAATTDARIASQKLGAGSAHHDHHHEQHHRDEQFEVGHLNTPGAKQPDIGATRRWSS